MKISPVILLIITLFSFVGFPQSDLFISKELRVAYEKGTRSFEGSPGENYWQNSADYKIKVTIDPVTRLVKGNEKIIFYNDSPDTLREIVFNIIQDLNKPETERSHPISPEALTAGVDIEKFMIGDSLILLDNNDDVTRVNTILILRIDEHPLPPESQTDFEIEWNFVIPVGKNPRMGTYDSTSFLIAYWYPQIAVYDDIDGWDKLQHNGEQEFYNDFSNYEVEITVPSSFGVWATGVLQNANEVLTSEYLERYENALTSDEVLNIVTRDEVRLGKIYNSDSEFNTWRYKAENITDFTFGMSDHYLWDAVSIVVDKNTNRRTYIAAVYKEESKDFYEVADISRKAIDYFSNVLPAVPFPFPSLTVFNGSGGMEFPMVINDGSTPTRPRTIGVTSHEIAHQYFPFFVGINEEKYSFMEEGMATFLPFDFQAEEGNYNPRYLIVLGYERYAGKEMEMPMMIPNYQLRDWARSFSIYFRPALAYDYLRDGLGKDLFNKCMHEYINRWKGKHPVPNDFFYTFNEVSGKDLSWYWKPWFFERGYPDLAVKNASYNNGLLEVTIEKTGIIPVPVKITVTCEDNSMVEIDETVMIWENRTNIAVIKREMDVTPVSLTLGTQMIPDSYITNNYFNFYSQ